VLHIANSGDSILAIKRRSKHTAARYLIPFSDQFRRHDDISVVSGSADVHLATCRITSGICIAGCIDQTISIVTKLQMNRGERLKEIVRD